MKVRFVRAWQRYRVGDVITPPALLRGWLVGRKFCTPVVETRLAPPVVAAATEAEPEDAVPADPPRQPRARRPRGDL